ncbi:MAG: hypothetical protein LUG54_03105 [Clostridiales bacterium]|nr:hypothetical protein [Clostridiales bacterium]
MRNSLSDRASSKILKFIAFFVILIAVYFIQGRWILPRFFTMPHAVLFAAVLAYLLISLSGLIMRASHKAAAAVLVFIALYALVIYFFDDFQAYVPFLTGTNIVRIVCAAAFALMVWDIYTAFAHITKHSGG